MYRRPFTWLYCVVFSISALGPAGDGCSRQIAGHEIGILRRAPETVGRHLDCQRFAWMLYLEDEELTSELVAPSLTVIEIQVFFDGREVGHGGYYRISRRSDTNGLVFKDIYCYSRLNTMVQLYVHKVIQVHAMVAARLTVSLSLTTCGVRNLVSIEGHKCLLSTRARQWRPVDLWSLAASAYLEWWRCGVLLQCCVASAMHDLCWRSLLSLMWSLLSLMWRPRVRRISRVPCVHGLGVRTAWHRIICYSWAANCSWVRETPRSHHLAPVVYCLFRLTTPYGRSGR